MSTSLLSQIAAVYRDSNVVGLPSTGSHDPIKAEIRTLLASIVATVANGGEELSDEIQADIAALVNDLEELEGTKTAVAADRVAAQAARVLAQAEAEAAAVSRAASDIAAEQAVAAAEAHGDFIAYDTKALATAALGDLDEGDRVRVWQDESQSGHQAIYVVEGAELVLKADLDLPAARLGIHDSRAIAATSYIPSATDSIRTSGYVDAGDGGGALYKRAASEPDHAGKVQSADGAWWELAEKAVSPQMLGASADGATDDIAAIQAANDYAEIVGGKMLLSGAYLIKSQLALSAAIEVVGRAKIIVATDFDGPTGAGSTVTGSAIINKNFDTVYDDETADEITVLGGLEIEHRSSTQRQTLTLANIKRLTLDRPRIITDTEARVDALIDFFACVRDAAIRDPDLRNLTGAAGGGCLWVRNVTSAGDDAENTTRDILLEGGTYQNNTGDEAVSVFGAQGLTERVTARKARFVGLTGGSDKQHLVTAFPLALNDDSATGANAGVRDILFDDCDFVDPTCLATTFRAGGNDLDVNRVTQNITVQNSRFYIKKSSVSTAYAMRNILGLGGNIQSINNTVLVDDSGELVTAAVIGFDVVRGLSAKGRITSSAVACANVESCPDLSGLGAVVDDCGMTIGNTITAPATGIQWRTAKPHKAALNRITLTNTSGSAQGILANGSLGAAYGEYDQNTVIADNAAAVLGTFTSGVGLIKARQNRGVGLGAASFTGESLLNEAWGNDHFGSRDANQKTISAGDASVVLSAQPDQIVFFGLPITDNRTVTLPATARKEGHKVRILRLAGATGAFNVSVVSGATLSDTGWLEYTFLQGAWRPTASGV